MAATNQHRALVVYEPTDASPEVTTLAGFLAGYSGRTREAYTLDLRQFVRWCQDRQLGLFEVTRTHIEVYARQLEDDGKAPATIGRRLSTLAGFYRYAAEEGVIEHSPAVHVRRPKLDYESHTNGLDRNELGAFLVQAGLSSPQDHALASLLGLNGLRISEALGANIEDLSLERGHRTLLVHRKGGKTVTIPLAPRTARALDLTIGERTEGPIFLGANDRRLTRDAAARMVRRLDPEEGIGFLRGGARPPIEVIVDFVDEHRDEFGVEPICRALQVAPSTYYAAKKRETNPSTRAVRDATMMKVLMVLWVANRKVYGAHKLWKAARRAGHDIGRDQVARLMRELNIQGISRRRNKVFTTVADPDAVRAPGSVDAVLI